MPKQKYYLECPIFSLVCLKDSILASVGGGGKRVGLKNSIQLFPLPRFGLVLKDAFFNLELGDDIIERLRLSQKINLIVGNSENKCVIYLLQDKQVIEVAKFVSDFAEKEPYQNDGVLNNSGTTLATGGEDGIVRLWSLTDDYKVEKLFEIDLESKIVSLDFHTQQPLLIVSTDKATLKFINHEKNEVIQSLVLNKNLLNLKFFTANFFGNHHQFFTITNQMRGGSYLTFWMMRADNSIIPLVTHKASKHPITASCLSNNGSLLGIGGSDGSTSIFDILAGEFKCQTEDHEMVVKGLAFTQSDRYLLSGSPDFTYSFQSNEKSTGWFTKLSILYLIILTIIGLTQLLLSIIQ